MDEPRIIVADNLPPPRQVGPFNMLAESMMPKQFATISLQLPHIPVMYVKTIGERFTLPELVSPKGTEFSHWEQNGKKIKTKSILVESNCTVVPIFQQVDTGEVGPIVPASIMRRRGNK